MAETDTIARLTRERDEARERASSLSRELLDAMQARDSYRASAGLRVGMRREFEALRVAANVWANPHPSLVSAVRALTEALCDVERLHAMTCATANPEGECLGCQIAFRMDKNRMVLAYLLRGLAHGKEPG